MSNEPNAVAKAARDTCAECGREIEFAPGQTYTASIDGRAWHYGCAPSRRAASNEHNAVDGLDKLLIVSQRELIEAQATELADLKRKLAGMEEALRDCVEYIEPMADADFIAGSYTGNTEMRLSVRARAALELGK